MKKVLKEIKRKEVVGNDIVKDVGNDLLTQTLTIETYNSVIWKPKENVRIFIEIEQPETIKEFIEQKGMTKKELVEWLNENYK